MIQAAPDVMNTAIPWLEWTGIHMSPWKLIGLVGALMFGGRWLVQFIASKNGGCGAVREVCEFILAAQGKLDEALAPYLPAAIR